MTLTPEQEATFREVLMRRLRDVVEVTIGPDAKCTDDGTLSTTVSWKIPNDADLVDLVADALVESGVLDNGESLKERLREHLSQKDLWEALLDNSNG